MCVLAYTLKCLLGDSFTKEKKREGERRKKRKKKGGWRCQGAVKKEKVKVL